MRRFAFTPVTPKFRRPRPSAIWSALPWCAAFTSACIYNEWDLKPEPPPAAAGASAGAEAELPTTGGAAGEQPSEGGTTAGGFSGRAETGQGGATGEQPSGGTTTIGGVGGGTDTGEGGATREEPSGGETGEGGASGADGCDLEQDFGEPFPVPFSAPGDRTDGRLTADEKTIYFHVNAGISKATWSEDNARFENETVVVNEDGVDEMSPSITDDGLELYYFGLDADPSEARNGLRVSRRKRIDEPFQPGEVLETLPRNAGSPFITPDGNTLYFLMTWAASAATKTDGVFSVTQPVTILGNEEPTFAMLPTVSADEKTIFVGSYDRVEGKDVWLIIRATRENVGDPFSGAGRIPSLVDANTENQPNWISRDGCRIYFHRRGIEGAALWMASRPDLE